jgi:hypothetical protein
LSKTLTKLRSAFCLFVRGIPYLANEWTVTPEIAMVLLADDFMSFIPGRPMDSQVKLNMENDGGIRNNVTETLTLPFKQSGYKFLDYIQNDPIKIETERGQRRFEFRIRKTRSSPPGGH